MKIPFLITVLFFTSYTKESCLQLDIVVLADTSASVSGNEQFITDAITTFAQRFKQTDVRISLLTFSDSPVTWFHLGDSVQFKIYAAEGNTSYTRALSGAIDELISSYSRTGYRKIIILISDGEANDPLECQRQLVLLKPLSISLMGIQIGNLNNNFMDSICDVNVHSNYNQLVEQLLKLDVCL